MSSWLFYKNCTCNGKPIYSAITDCKQCQDQCNILYKDPVVVCQPFVSDKSTSSPSFQEKNDKSELFMNILNICVTVIVITLVFFITSWIYTGHALTISRRYGKNYLSFLKKIPTYFRRDTIKKKKIIPQET